MSRPSGPRIRSFKPERYHDERFAGVSRDARHLYDGLTTQADDDGRGTANRALIKATVMPYDEDVTAGVIGSWLQELVTAELIVLYGDGQREFYSIVSWADDQRVDKPTESKFPPPPSRVPREADTNARESSGIPREESPNNAESTPQSQVCVPRDSSRAIANPRLARAGADHDRDRDQGSDQDPFSPAAADEPERADVHRLCLLLADLIRENDPKAQPNPNHGTWLTACRLLLDKDRRSVEEVEHVIRWSQTDAFWRANILSMPKLREKFAQLSLKSQAPGAARGGPPSAADFLVAGGAA